MGAGWEDTVSLDLSPLPDVPGPDGAASRAGRIVTGLLVETMLEVDCTGRVRPGLAEAWTMEGDAAAWTFRLRPTARFSDGSPVDARAIEAAWSVRRQVSVVPVDRRTVRARFADPVRDPRVFATQEMAVVRREGGAWPVGTTGYRMGEDGTHLLPRSAGLPVMVVRAARDPRDRPGVGPGLAVSADPAVLDYLRTRPQTVVVPLSWDRVYRLFAPVDLAARLPGEATWPADLAREAVRTSARAAEPPFWWGTARGCEPDLPSPAAPRLLYAVHDPTAAALAGRIRALTGVRLKAVPHAELSAALRRPGVAVLWGGWRESAGTCRPGGRVVTIPLVDTRAHLVVRGPHGPIRLRAGGLFGIEGNGR